jgi:hypothetical protein
MMARPARLLTAIKSFTARAYREPIWPVMTVIFLSCVGFIAAYQSSYPEDRARLENSINERNVQVEDAESMVELHKRILAGNEMIKMPLAQFLSIVDDITATGQVGGREREVRESQQSAADIKKQTELLLADVKGTHFRVPMYEEEARTYEVFLSTEIGLLEAIEAFCTAYLSGDATHFARKVQETEGRFSDLRKEEQTMLARQQGLVMQLDSTLKSNVIENEKVDALAWRHRVKGVGQIFAAVFSFVYVLAICVGVRNSYNEPSANIPRLKKIVRRPKKRNSGRRNRKA